MILFTKSLGSLPQGGRQNFADYHRRFGLHDMKSEPAARLYQWRMTRASDELPETPPEKHAIAIADLAATLSLDMYLTPVLCKQGQFVDTLLALSRDLLVNMGYSELDVAELSKFPHDEKNLVMVAGCQHEDILASRIRAAVELLMELLNNRRSVEILFSGSSPGGLVRIQNECTRMQQLFRQELRRLLPEKPDDVSRLMGATVTLDPKAQTSKENVREFLSRTAAQLITPCRIFVVTSTFHLRRLCYTLEQELYSRTRRSQVNRRIKKHRIQQIIAVGAEPTNGSIVAQNPAYVKSMSFECARSILEDTAFWPSDVNATALSLFQREREGRLADSSASPEASLPSVALD